MFDSLQGAPFSLKYLVVNEIPNSNLALFSQLMARHHRRICLAQKPQNQVRWFVAMWIVYMKRKLRTIDRWLGEEVKDGDGMFINSGLEGTPTWPHLFHVPWIWCGIRIRNVSRHWCYRYRSLDGWFKFFFFTWLIVDQISSLHFTTEFLHYLSSRLRQVYK